MEPLDKERLRINNSILMSDLDANFVINDLISAGVITLDEMEEILQTEPRTRLTRNRLLVTMLPRKGKQAYASFCEALENNGFQHIREALDSSDVKPTTEDWFTDIPEDIKNTKPSDKQIMTISKDIGMNWEIIGVSLDLSQPEIEQCKMKHPHVPVMQIVTMFTRWKSKNGSNATMATLANAVRGNTVFDNAFKDVVTAMVLDSVKSVD